MVKQKIISPLSIDVTIDRTNDGEKQEEIND